MAKIHNMIRVVGQPGSEEYDIPEGFQVLSATVLGATTPEEQTQVGAGYKVLYVLVPAPVVPEPVAAKVGRPTKNE
jgi:hypothetical protein